MCGRGPRTRTPHCSKMAALFILLRHGGPGFVRIEALHLYKFTQARQSKIFLVDNPILADGDCLYSSPPILGRCSDQRESADHHAFYDVVHLAEWCRRPLPLQNLEEISMVWLRTSCVALLEDESYFFAHRTSPASIRVLPSESVLFARSADNPLGILVYLVALAFLQRIFVLRFHVATTDVDGIEFVAADTAIEQLSAARFRIKGPFVTHLHNRYRERPVLVAHKNEFPIAGLPIHGNAFLFRRR